METVSFWKRLEVFNDLSDFQQGVLELFANTEEPMPIHTVFQMLSIQQVRSSMESIRLGMLRQQ